MAPKIASSVVETGPNDEVAAVDAYATTPSAVEEKLAPEPSFFDNISSKASEVASNLSDSAAGAIDSVSSGEFGVNDALGYIKFDGKDTGLNYDKITGAAKKVGLSALVGNGDASKRVNKAAGQAISSIPGVNPDMVGYAEELLPGLLSGETGELIAASGEYIKIGMDADTSSASGIIAAVKKLTGASAIADYIDQTAFLATAMVYFDEAIRLGIPDILDGLWEDLKNDKRAKARLINSVRSVILRSDIHTLNKIIGWVGAEGVLSRVPDACTLLLAVYRFPRKTKPEEYPAKRAELLGVLNKLDVNWSKVQRNGVMIPALKPFLRVSSNAKLLLQLEAGYDVDVMVAKHYPPVDLDQLAFYNFPRMRAW